MLTWKKITLKLRDPFRLSYGSSEKRQVYWVTLGKDEGWGESAIPPYYGIPDKEILAYFEHASTRKDPFPEDFQEIGLWVDPNGPAPARCALDLALYDRIGKKRGLPLYRLLGLPLPLPKTSSFTIAIDTPENMARKASMVNGYPILKIKLGGDGQDLERLGAIRDARPDAVVRVDANAGWGFEEAMQYLKKLEEFDLEQIEQPLRSEDISGMGKLQAQTEIPIVADESVKTLQNVEDLARAGVRGINLKLMKVGGITPALEIINKARQYGMKIMLGCMIETSLGITAMAHLSGLADWLDLDASLLVTNDPFEGMWLDEHAATHVPERPGIGLKLRGTN